MPGFPRPRRRGNPNSIWGLTYGPCEETSSSDSRRDTADETHDYFNYERGRDELMSRERRAIYPRARIDLSVCHMESHVDRTWRSLREWRRPFFIDARKEDVDGCYRAWRHVNVFVRRAIRFRSRSDWQLRHRYCVPGEIDCGIARRKEKETVCWEMSSWEDARGRSIGRALYVAIIRNKGVIYHQAE